jgi:hypothetical protein
MNITNKTLITTTTTTATSSQEEPFIDLQTVVMICLIFITLLGSLGTPNGLTLL